jgi:hypothetical protein
LIFIGSLLILKYFCCVGFNQIEKKTFQHHQKKKTKKQQMDFFITALLVILLVVFLRMTMAQTQILASESDFGKFTLRASGNDAFLYFVDNLDLVNKVHMVVSEPVCKCIGTADVQKINQIDYMAAKEYLFSFGVYVNDGKFGYNRSTCDLTTAEIQHRTSLDFNLLGAAGVSARQSADDGEPNFSEEMWQAILQEMEAIRREGDTYYLKVEGATLLRAIDDFHKHSYVSSHRAQIFDSDKSGGILFTQGSVFIRPCLLWPWYQSWILDDYGDDELVNDNNANYRFKFTLPFDDVTLSKNIPYFTRADAEVFNAIVDKMKRMGVIKEKHIANLVDNTGSQYFTKSFSFQALFIPHRYVDEFTMLLRPFAWTYLSPSLYIPFIYQLMWDRNEWIHMRSDRNNTIYAKPQKLLSTCYADNVDDMMHTVDEPLAEEMFYFAYGWCGGYPVDVKYIYGRTASFVLYHFYEVMTYLFISILGCMCCCFCCCSPSRPAAKCFIKSLARIQVCFSSCGRKKKPNVAYNKVDELDALAATDGEDDEDDDDVDQIELKSKKITTDPIVKTPHNANENHKV